MDLGTLTSGAQAVAGAIGGKAAPGGFKNAWWMFEVWDENGPKGNGGATDPYSFLFRWPPTGWHFEQALRSDVVLDLLGKPATSHLGPGLGRMTMQGSHGVGIQGIKAGAAAAGIVSRDALRALYDLWEQEVRAAQAEGGHLPKLVLSIRNGGATEWQNQEWNVWPIGFPNDERNATHPLEWPYSISLWVLGPPGARSTPYSPPASPDLTTLDRILATIGGLMSKVKRLRAIGKKIKVAVTALKNLIKAGRGYILQTLTDVHTYIADMNALADEITDLLAPAAFNADVSAKLRQIQRDLKQTVGAVKRMLKEGIRLETANGTRRMPQPAPARKSPMPQGAAPLLVTAANELGDSSRWKDIAKLNDLPFPYTRAGLLDLPLNVPETPEAVAADPVGTDEDPAGRPGVLIGGAENLVNAVLRRLRCQRGYLPHQPNYGSLLHRFLGQPFDVATALSVRGEVERTILEDERVTRITTLSVSASDSLDAFVVLAQVECAFGIVQIAGEITSDGVRA